MLSFDEIEDCFPEWGGTTDDGAMICSAQWLHDFAHAVAAKEREACAKVCEKHKGSYWFRNSDGEEVDKPLASNAIITKCAAAIRARSNDVARDFNRI